MKMMNSKYKQMSNMLCRPEEGTIWNELAKGKLKWKVKSFKEKVVNFSGGIGNEFFTLKFRLL